MLEVLRRVVRRVKHFFYNFIFIIYKMADGSETIRSESFLRRVAEDRENCFSPDKKCASNGKNYQYSEYITSLFIHEFHNSPNADILFDFVFDIAKNLCGSLGINYRDEFIVYLTGMQNSVQKDEYDNYPYANTNFYKSIPNLEKVKSFNNEEDFKVFLRNTYKYVVLFNFVKWMWIKIDKKEYKDQNGNVTLGCNILTFYKIIQQRIFYMQSLVKGPRLNINKNPSNKQIGITNIVDPSLDLFENWAHPGRDQCLVPYYGTTGQQIQIARESLTNLNYSGSLQCGLSGSVNFFLFMYLSSILHLDYKEKEEYEIDVSKLIMLSIMVLAGDGGHNIREIIYGMTTTVILLHIIVKNMKENYDKGITVDVEDDNLNFKLYKHIITKYPEFQYTSKKAFNEVFFNFSNKCLPFTTIYYKLTLNLNVLGVTEDHLRQKNQLETPVKYFIGYIKNIFTEIESKESPVETALNLHYFFAKINDRYKQDFNRGYLDFFTDIIKYAGFEEIEKNALKRFRQHVKTNNCNVDYSGLVYAFKSAKKSKKSAKKSKKSANKSAKKSKKSAKKSKSLKKSKKSVNKSKKSVNKSKKSAKKSKKSAKKSKKSVNKSKKSVKKSKKSVKKSKKSVKKS